MIRPHGDYETRVSDLGHGATGYAVMRWLGPRKYKMLLGFAVCGNGRRVAEGTVVGDGEWDLFEGNAVVLFRKAK